MKVIPIALYLKERAVAPLALDDGQVIPLPAPSLIDTSAEIEEAFARGKQEGEETARTACEAELQAMAAKHQSELAEERARWAAEQGGELAARLCEMVGEMERRLADAVGHLLAPVLTESARRTAIAEFSTAAKSLWEQRPEEVLHISGPADLIEAIKARLGEDINAQYSANDHCEARIEAGDAVIETQFAAWAKQLGEAMS